MKPKLANNGQVIDAGEHQPTISFDSTFDPKLKKKEDGSLGVDMGMKSSAPKVKVGKEEEDTSPSLSFDTSFKPSVDMDDNGDVKVGMKPEAGKVGVAAGGHQLSTDQL